MSTEAPRRALYERREQHERARQENKRNADMFFEEALRVSQGLCPPEHEHQWARAAALLSSDLSKTVTIQDAGRFAVIYKIAMAQ